MREILVATKKMKRYWGIVRARKKTWMFPI
jgi:hypothetical protein